MGPGLERAFDLWSMVQEAAGVDLVALRKPVRNQVKKSAFSGTLGMSMFNSCCASENSCFSPEFNFYFFYIGFSMIFSNLTCCKSSVHKCFKHKMDCDKYCTCFLLYWTGSSELCDQRRRKVCVAHSLQSNSPFGGSLVQCTVQECQIANTGHSYMSVS